MKKLLLIGLVIGTMSVVSCKKCKTCTKAGFDDQIECRGSGPFAQVEFDEDVNYWLEQGYECK